MLRAILEIISRLLGFLPNRNELDDSRARGEWRKNRDSIDRDLAPQPWWLRDNAARGEDERQH
jgi:hypothetical protein